MLEQLIMSGFGRTENYNCAEKILYGANKAYHLGMSEEILKISSGFGGGMMIEKTCGAVTASVMVLGLKFTSTVAHESELLKPIIQNFIKAYEEEMKSIECGPLKADFRTEAEGCHMVILKAAHILDHIIIENEL